MAKQREEQQKDRFPISLYGIYLGVLLLMSGIHTGIILFLQASEWTVVVQVVIPIAYWSAVAIGLTIFTRYKMRKTYEEPLQKFARATKAVAKGDFSVYLPTIHTSDQLDYLDLMILDFNKMVEELGSIETLKTDFISNVSHEMKTPIAVIKNYSQLLEAGNLTEAEQREYASAIEEAATRLGNLITNILRLNKLENQRITPEYARYDVCEQLCECIFQFEALLDEKEIDLETNLDARIYIQADPSLMELVWNNLISNAIKFMEPGGKLEIMQQLREAHVIISVRDQGCGMSHETMAHIFDKFYQGDTSHASEGNGLGLALVCRVLELMNGDLQVDSRLGEGSVFSVSLPVAADASHSAVGRESLECNSANNDKIQNWV